MLVAGGARASPTPQHEDPAVTQVSPVGHTAGREGGWEQIQDGKKPQKDALGRSRCWLQAAPMGMTLEVFACGICRCGHPPPWPDSGSRIDTNRTPSSDRGSGCGLVTFPQCRFLSALTHALTPRGADPLPVPPLSCHSPSSPHHPCSREPIPGGFVPFSPISVRIQSSFSNCSRELADPLRTAQPSGFPVLRASPPSRRYSQRSDSPVPRSSRGLRLPPRGGSGHGPAPTDRPTLTEGSTDGPAPTDRSMDGLAPTLTEGHTSTG